MNKKGSVILYSLMIGLTIIVVALALAPAVQESTERARNVTDGDAVGLNCSNDSISNFDKATCVATDLTLFYFVGSLLLIGGVIVGAKIIFS